MKKIMMILAVAALMVGCGGNNKAEQEQGLNLIKAENFDGEVDGKKVGLYTLTNGTITMQVTNFGGRVVSLWTPDRDGNMADIVLGYESLDRYVNNAGERFLGAPVGRVANRIGAGKFTLDGKEYNTPLNNNGQTLHGGLKGIDMVVWDVKYVADNAITLHLLSEDGSDGFPGNLDIEMTYTLTEDNEFEVTYHAKTDKKTIVNLSHHSFFNLKGEAGGTITDHVLTINADNVTPTDANLIPTGELMPVEGTPFDFREPHRIDYRIDMPNEHLRIMKGMSACWVIRDWDGTLRRAADLYDKKTGRGVETWTTEPALLTYTGRGFSEEKYPNGKYGPIVKFAGMLLETIHFPDSPNQKRFPSTVLRPGEKYHSVTQYRFYAK